MAGVKEIQSTDRELTPAIERLSQAIVKEITRLARDESVVDKDELMAISAEHREAMFRHNAIVRDAYIAHAGSPTRDQVESYKQFLVSSLLHLQRLRDRVDVCEEMFHRYNVPRALSGKLAERFMTRSWREEAERGRARGCKTLNEWLRRLGREKIRTVGFDEVRLAEVEIGTRISRHLGSYIALIAASGDRQGLERKIRGVEAVLARLKVEKKSMITDRFLAALRYVERSLSPRLGLGRARGNDAVSPIGGSRIESDLVHLILREVLRLEVAFGCPDLPMMLIDEVLVGMAKHLRNVFEQKLCRVSYVMDLFRKELFPSSTADDEGPLFAADVLDHGIKEIWEKLDLMNSRTE